MQPFKPTKADLADAIHRQVPDIIAPNLRILFVGINPGIYTAAVRHHFAHPSNRFWKALHDSGITPEPLTAFDNEKLLRYGMGITNIVQRPTKQASELRRDELQAGWKRLERKVQRYKPRWIAICGLDAYRKAINPKALLGEQPETINGTRIWVVPNPSGLNANFTPKRLAEVFGELKERVEADEKQITPSG